MDTNTTFNVGAVFSRDANEILAARNMAGHIHASRDVRAAGNEVEVAVRDYFARALPTKFHVTHGHLIDRVGTVSPQQDIIISDNTLLPSLMRAKDGTEYVPFDSTYVFGEIKSTYRHADKQIQKFSENLRKIKEGMVRPDLPNTAYGGEIKDDTLLFDMVHASPNRIQNPLLTFMVFVDKGDFDCEKIKNFLVTTPDAYLPNVIVFLNAGVVLAAGLTEKGFSFNRYPELHPERGTTRYFSPIYGRDDSTIEGNHLAYLYYTLVLHLSEARIENSFSAKYFEKSFVFRKSTTTLVKG